MKILRIRPHDTLIAFVCAAIMLYAGCNNTPLLTEMGTSRLLIVIKGTYETNSPAPWNMPPTPTTNSLIQDDSVNDCNTVDDPLPTAFMIDVAEMKIMGMKGKIYNFSKYRQAIIASLDDVHPMFNGVGWVLTSDDVPSGGYLAVGLYIRKMLFDQARVYIPGGGGWSGQMVVDIFAEQYLNAFNFNAMQTLSYYDTLRIEQYFNLNRVYPLVIPIQNGLVFNKDYPYTVLEIRMVIKNFVKKYETEGYNADGIFSVTHFYAMSDYLRNVKADDAMMGGNIITAARSYIPGIAGRIAGTCGGGINQIVFAVPAGDPLSKYQVPAAGSFVRGSATGAIKCDFPKVPGVYLGINPEPAIDYYLALEKYKYDLNVCVSAGSLCNTFEIYQTQWDAYIKNVNEFTLPPVATYVSSSTTSYVLENVMPGTYDVYRATQPTYGNLFVQGTTTFTGPVTVTVPAGGTVAADL